MATPRYESDSSFNLPEIYVGSPDGLIEPPLSAEPVPGDMVAISIASIHRQLKRRGIDPMHAKLYIRGGGLDVIDEISAAKSEWLRKLGDEANPVKTINTFADERIVVNGLMRKVYVDGNEIYIPQAVYRFYAAISSKVDEAITRQDLMDAIWGCIDVRPGNLTVMVKRARDALCSELSHPKKGAIQTVYDYGYMARSSIKV